MKRDEAPSSPVRVPRHWGHGSRSTARRAFLETNFGAYARFDFAAHPTRRSLLLTVAQYWNDEADDAVHPHLVASKQLTPRWPHNCVDRGEADADRCNCCGGRFAWMPANSNNPTFIAAFEGCCREGANQDMSNSVSHLPYAIARRVSAPGASLAAETEIEIEIEIVGGPFRAWCDVAREPRPTHRPRPARSTRTEALLDAVRRSPEDDAPRVVLSDHLHEIGDPLGEYISLALATARTRASADSDPIAPRLRALEDLHGTSWLGPLGQVAPAEYVRFARGFVDEVAAFFAAPPTEELANAPEWATVRALRFLPQSEVHFTRAMTALRQVGPIAPSRLDAEVAPRLHELHVALDSAAELDALTKLALPNLRRLTVSATEDGLGVPAKDPEVEGILFANGPSWAALGPQTLAPLVTSAIFERLDRLTIASIQPDVVGEWLARPPRSRPAELVFTAVMPDGETAGLRLTASATSLVLEMPSLGLDFDLPALLAVLAALPAEAPSVVTLRPTRVFEPTAAELAQITGALGPGRRLVVAR